MHQKAKFGLAFIPEVNCQILEMSYIGKELSMLIILPNEIEDDSTGLERVRLNLLYNKLMVLSSIRQGDQDNTYWFGRVCGI